MMMGLVGVGVVERVWEEGGNCVKAMMMTIMDGLRLVSCFCFSC